MSRRKSCIAALMVLNVSSSWAQADQISIGHSYLSDAHGKKPILAPSKAVPDIEALPGMDHSKMNHDSMPGMKSNEKTSGTQYQGHGMNTGGAISGKVEAMSSMNHDGGNSISTVPQDIRDPHAYSDGYDFGPIPRPQMGDEELLGSLLVDRLESTTNRGSTAMTYDWQAWLGNTYDRAVIRAEGSIEGGAFVDARNELLWAHAITAFWDTQLGVRYDSGQGVDRGWLAFGLQGTAPYWIYVEATAYVNEQGHTAFRLETEYDLLFTQRLILQPRIEMNFYSQRDDSRNVSSGLSDFAGGARLRYEILREFAPYVGVEWVSSFGSAADNSKTAGQVAEGIYFVAGVHLWF